MIVLTLTTKKKRLRDFFIKPETPRHFYNYTFPKEAAHEPESNDRDK